MKKISLIMASIFLVAPLAAHTITPGRKVEQVVHMCGVCCEPVGTHDRVKLNCPCEKTYYHNECIAAWKVYANACPGCNKKSPEVVAPAASTKNYGQPTKKRSMRPPNGRCTTDKALQEAILTRFLVRSLFPENLTRTISQSRHDARIVRKLLYLMAYLK